MQVTCCRKSDIWRDRENGGMRKLDESANSVYERKSQSNERHAAKPHDPIAQKLQN
jgi:hypothetical protein